MVALNPSTIRRLQKLQQVPSVWEGDRRPIYSESSSNPELESETTNECIIWVDGSHGMVRAMDMVTPDTGPEAIVRTLLRAMENPQSPAPAIRPQKIVVKDREIQFFLRGVLQNLGIAIDYVPDLPLIDEIFRGLQEVSDNRPPQLPPEYAEALVEKADQIWDDAPWEILGEHQIISIELNQWDIENLYVCVLGKLGMDYGILLYRSLDSLKRFRERVTYEKSYENLEEAFLGQDCLFITYDSFQEDDEDNDNGNTNLENLSVSEIQANFGNLHPLEGLRSVLYEEEALTTLVTLEALHRFLRASRKKMTGNKFPSISSRYRIPIPKSDRVVSIKVTTMPEVAEELYEIAVESDSEGDEELEIEMPMLKDDLVPQNSFLSLGVVPWETVEYLRDNTKQYQAAEEDIELSGEGLPIILIQTSLPKATKLIGDLEEAQGLHGIGFNPGEDPVEEKTYDLGILKTYDGVLHLFGEFMQNDPVHQEARQKWDERCIATRGWCGLIIARGITGASRGQPEFKDMMALFEVRFLSSQELGVGPLKLMPVSF
ncbi:MAG: hypothetical protein F6K22_11160 [Okeania sp. SIO2F4]|uniref:DUF6930 domain-containing protein n=1 Tax=Okeania sp. SIO2F4 TaxID=2607790 RepID=UPI00142CCE60|nr:hypothetical protein [Okeania sp. SIO2F4]NES03352.1 hypothetical protein [Okeania sp. SIO2F4]